MQWLGPEQDGGRMAMGEDSAPLFKRDEQVDATIDQRTVDNSSNPDPESLTIDPSELFIQATEQTRMAMIVSDPFKDDCPIIYANEAFVRLTGYTREETIGRNCRFLQGPDTSPNAVAMIGEALANEDVAVVDILNYMKDGTQFWNALHVGPIFDEQGKLTYFYGSMWDVTAKLEAREEHVRQEVIAEELQHRTNNLFAMLSAMITITVRGETDAAVFADKLQKRIQALSKAHTASIAPGGRVGVTTRMIDLTKTVMEPYRNENRDAISLAGDNIELPKQFVTPVGLTLHELATNAVKYGSLGRPEGTVTIEWSHADGQLLINWIERGGSQTGNEEAADVSSSSGSRLIRGILQGQGGSMEQWFGKDGFRAEIRIPLLIAIDDRGAAVSTR